MNIYVWNNEWLPGENTLVYYPLTSTTTVNDMSGNNRNLTNSWVTFWTYAGVDCAYFPRSNSKKLYWTLPLSWTQNFTFNVWINRQWKTFYEHGNWQIVDLWNPWTNYVQFWIGINDDSNKYVAWTRWNDKTASTTNTTNTWNMVTVTHQSWTVKMYVNWTLIINDTISFNVANTNFTVWSFQSGIDSQTDYFAYYWYMSKLICESSIWTAQEVSDYYNSTKSNYWL